MTKAVTKEELQETVSIISSKVFPSFIKRHYQDAFDLLREREDLEKMLKGSGFKILPHVDKGYKARIEEINLFLSHLTRIARIIKEGYFPIYEYEGYGGKCAGFIENPGRIIKSSEDRAMGYHYDSHKIHYHATYFNFIPPRVLQSYSEAKSLFDQFLVFSERGEDFLSLIDQRHSDFRSGKRIWLDVTKIDWFQKEMQEKIQHRVHADVEVLLVGFVPEKPLMELELSFEFKDWCRPKVNITNGLGFLITSWNPKKEFEKVHV